MKDWDKYKDFIRPIVAFLLEAKSRGYHIEEYDKGRYIVYLTNQFVISIDMVAIITTFNVWQPDIHSYVPVTANLLEYVEMLGNGDTIVYGDNATDFLVLKDENRCYFIQELIDVKDFFENEYIMVSCDKRIFLYDDSGKRTEPSAEELSGYEPLEDNDEDGVCVKSFRDFDELMDFISSSNDIDFSNILLQKYDEDGKVIGDLTFDSLEQLRVFLETGELIEDDNDYDDYDDYEDDTEDNED